MSTPATPSADVVNPLVREIFGDFLGIPIMSGEVSAQGSAGQPVYAMVRFVGGWTGALEVQFSNLMALRTAGAMFELELGELEEEEILDAVGEVANLIAGALLPHLPASSNLDTPEVTGVEVARQSFGGQTAHPFLSECSDQLPFRVVIHRQD